MTDTAVQTENELVPTVSFERKSFVLSAEVRVGGRWIVDVFKCRSDPDLKEGWSSDPTRWEPARVSWRRGTLYKEHASDAEAMAIGLAKAAEIARALDADPATDAYS